MNLWIRSQDKTALIKADRVDVDGKRIVIYQSYLEIYLGSYATKERALEVLDEITNTIKNRYIVKSSGILSQDDITNEHKRLKYFYNGEFIMENPPFEIEPINSNIIYYEMPKE